jgi:hypothetical protein
MGGVLQDLVEWISDLVERRYGRMAGCAAVLVCTGVFIAAIWLALRLWG